MERVSVSYLGKGRETWAGGGERMSSGSREEVGNPPSSSLCVAEGVKTYGKLN